MDEKVKVMAISSSRDTLEMLADLINRNENLEWAGYSYHEPGAQERILQLNPDVILVDITAPHIDGVAFLEQLIRACPARRPKIIVMTAVADQGVIRNLTQLGVEYYLLKPIDPTILVNRIKQIAEGSSPQVKRDPWCTQEELKEDVEAHAARLLFQLGAPTYFKGYLYLKEAVCMIIKEVHIDVPVTTTLYRRIAGKHDTTPSVVEAAIRYTIRQTWRRGNLKQLKKLFGPFSDLTGTRIPTNSLFITRIAEEIRASRSY